MARHAVDARSGRSATCMVGRCRNHRRALALAALDAKLYVIGGLTEKLDFSQEVNIYDPATGQWSFGPDLPKSEYNGFGSSAFAVNDRLYASSLSDQLLVLSDDGNNWQQFATLRTPRFFHRLVPGLDGTILLIGGANDGDGHLATITCVRAE